MKLKNLITFICIMLILVLPANGYKVSPPNNVTHQYIANESQKIWSLIPYEIKLHLGNAINRNTGSNSDYNLGDDIIDGTREEDLPLFAGRFLRHFWEPDNPKNGKYSDGLIGFDSNWERAYGFWQNNVIPAYLRGDIDEAYYWLGRVAHLLEDTAVPAHVHKDKHAPPTDDALEEFLGLENFWSHGDYNYRFFDGNDYKNQYYYYENLTDSLTENDWREINQRLKQGSYPQELFKLFWYTAQKTQYFASDQFDGDNGAYEEQDGDPRTFSPSLWDASQTIISDNAAIEDDDNEGPNIAAIANASIPHSMKAVAGLYRLFDDAVRIDWPTENHDYRRTGFTLLKITSPSKPIYMPYFRKNKPKPAFSTAKPGC